MGSTGLEHIFALTNEYRSIKYDLRNMQVLMDQLDNPQRSFHSILIAGTNGKGSVAALLAAMMPGSGLFTSPHLTRINERIQIGNDQISDADLQVVYDKVSHAAAAARNLIYPPKYFESMKAMASA